LYISYEYVKEIYILRLILCPRKLKIHVLTTYRMQHTLRARELKESIGTELTDYPR